MDELEVRTVVYASPEDIYDLLIDFPRYTRYTEYLETIGTDGDGGPGTEYTLTFAWWKVKYTVSSRVTEVERPERIEFELVRGIRATGTWRIEHAPERADEGEACEVTLSIRYDPGTVASDAVRLPRFVSIDWVVRRAKPLLEREARRVVERAVADLEGRRRDVELAVQFN